jgi:hypothetical protein
MYTILSAKFAEQKKEGAAKQFLRWGVKTLINKNGMI